MIRLRLACRPVILNSVLAQILGTRPGIELVQAGADAPDIAINSSDSENVHHVYPRDQLRPNSLVITLDGPRNTIWLRDTSPGGVGEEILPGDLNALLKVIDRVVDRERRIQPGRIA